MIKNNVIIGIEDDYTSIYIWFSFNNQVIPLYFNSINNERSILNGSVYDKQKYTSLLKKLINQAKSFLEYEISEANICLHHFNINITNFETSIKLKNGIFNKAVWMNEIQPNLQIIMKNPDQYIYDFEVIKWKINDKVIKKIDYEYKTNEVLISGKKYIINKLVYDAYNEIFNELKLRILDFSTTLNLYKTNNLKNQLNILIGRNELSIASISDNHLMSNVVCDDKGINLLIKMIKEKIHLESKEDDIINHYLKKIEFYKKKPNLDVIEQIDKNISQIKKINQALIDEIISEYAKVILDLITEKVEYYQKYKDQTIDVINLISNSPIIQQIFNIFSYLSKYHFNIVKPNNIPLYENKYIYCILNAQKNLKELKLKN